MKSKSSDIPRIDEEAPSELGDLVHGARGEGVPSAAALERMAKKLAVSGAFGAPSPSPVETVTNAGPFGHISVGKVSAIVAVCLGAGLFAYRVADSAWAPASPELAVTVEDARPSSLEPPSAPEPRSDVPVISVSALPPSKPSPRPSSAPSKHADRLPSTKESPVARAPAASGEFALIQRAQAALPSDPALGLAIADEHARAFPAGELTQEREVVAVEALSRLGRRAEAKRRASALLERFPSTPYEPRLERALGERVSPAPSPTP